MCSNKLQDKASSLQNRNDCHFEASPQELEWLTVVTKLGAGGFLMLTAGTPSQSFQQHCSVLDSRDRYPQDGV